MCFKKCWLFFCHLTSQSPWFLWAFIYHHYYFTITFHELSERREKRYLKPHVLCMLVFLVLSFTDKYLKPPFTLHCFMPKNISSLCSHITIPFYSWWLYKHVLLSFKEKIFPQFIYIYIFFSSRKTMTFFLFYFKCVLLINQSQGRFGEYMAWRTCIFLSLHFY